MKAPGRTGRRPPATGHRPPTTSHQPPATPLFYSGHRRSSYPRALVIDGKEALVEGIVRHEVCEDFATRGRKHVFICSVGKKLWEVIRFDDDTTTCRRLPADRKPLTAKTPRTPMQKRNHG